MRLAALAVAWVVGRLNLKHRHVYKPPLAKSIREPCIHLERKVLWRWHRDNKWFLDANAPWRISNTPVAENTGFPSPELRPWILTLRQAAMGAFTPRDVERETRSEALDWVFLKMLRESEICAMLCDKEGLFCTMPTMVPFCLHKGVFEASSGYCGEHVSEEPHESVAFLQACRSLARRIAKLEPDESTQASMAVAINPSWRGDRRFHNNLSPTSRATIQRVRLEFGTYTRAQ